MSLTITKQEDEQRQLAMSIEVDEKRMTGEMKKIARDLAKRMNVPGFRPGKAPFGVVVKRVGEEALRAQAIEDMLNEIIFEALETEEIVPYARPTLQDMEVKPAKIDIIVPLEPVVTLGEYREIRRELERPEVTDEAVEEAVEEFIERKTTTEEITDRASAEGDMIKVTGKGVFKPADDAEKDAEPDVLFEEENGIEFLLDAEKTFQGTDFVSNLIDKSVGDSLEFSITYADDYEVSDFAGRQVDFNLDVIELQNRIVPELNDELVKEDNYEDVADFRAKTRETLETQAFETFRGEVLDEWILDLKKDATLVYPPGAVDAELDDRLEGFKRQISSYGWNWEDYMNMQNESEDQIKENWREDVTVNVENGLILREFISAEKLKLEDDEFNELVEERLESFGEMEENIRESMREVLMGDESRQRMGNELMVRKAFDRIEAILAGNAPDLSELEEDETEEESAAGDSDSAEEASEETDEVADVAESTEESAEDEEESSD